MLRSIAWCVLCALCAAVPQGVAAQQTPAAEAEVATAPVILDGVELFRVRGVSSVPPDVRAAHIEQQIAAVAATSMPVDALEIVDTQAANRIQAGDRVIMAVIDADAVLEQVDRHALATAHLHRIRQAITDYRNDRTPVAIRQDAIRVLAATLIFVAALFAIIWLSRLAERALAARLRSRIHTVGIQSFEVLRAERIWDALHSVVVAIRAVVVLTAVLIWVAYVLARFPWTRGLGGNITAFVMSPIQQMAWAFIHNIPKLTFLAVLFVIVRLVLKIIRSFFGALERGAVTLGKFSPDWAQPTYKMIRVAVIAFALVVAYPYIPGSNSAAFQGISLFIGLVFSLGSSSVIANIIAGYALIYRRAFKIGDRIKIGDAVGEVIEMRLQVTHLRSIKNEEIIIPNSQIMTGDVFNFSSIARERGLILHTEVGIGYDTSWRQVEVMLLEAAGRMSNLGTDPKPFVLLKRLGDFAVVYELNVFCTNVHLMMALYAELHRHILDVFNEHGVQIMTPAYESDPDVPKLVQPEDRDAPLPRPQIR